MFGIPTVQTTGSSWFVAFANLLKTLPADNLIKYKKKKRTPKNNIL